MVMVDGVVGAELTRSCFFGYPADAFGIDEGGRAAGGVTGEGRAGHEQGHDQRCTRVASTARERLVMSITEAHEWSYRCRRQST